MFYFSGHGMLVDGINYFVPAKMAKVSNPKDLIHEALPVTDVAILLADGEAKVKIIAADACRSGFLDGTLGRRAVKGAQPIKATWTEFSTSSLATNTYIMYSTSEGAVSLAGSDLSIFTRELVELLQGPRMEIDTIGRRLQRNVRQASERLRKLEPSAPIMIAERATKMEDEFYFRPAVAGTLPARASPAPQTGGAVPLPDEECLTCQADLIHEEEERDVGARGIVGGEASKIMAIILILAPCLVLARPYMSNAGPSIPEAAHESAVTGLRPRTSPARRSALHNAGTILDPEEESPWTASVEQMAIEQARRANKYNKEIWLPVRLFHLAFAPEERPSRVSMSTSEGICCALMIRRLCILAYHHPVICFWTFVGLAVSLICAVALLKLDSPERWLVAMCATTACAAGICDLLQADLVRYSAHRLAQAAMSACAAFIRDPIQYPPEALAGLLRSLQGVFWFLVGVVSGILCLVLCVAVCASRMKPGARLMTAMFAAMLAWLCRLLCVI